MPDQKPDWFHGTKQGYCLLYRSIYKMALVSPGVSVTITDEAFFIPAAAPTVPLFFIATADEKLQQDGVTDASGTFESGTVRTVTSQKQVLELYGVPGFLEDSSGNQYHGDARNEYGLYSVWQFMAQGSRAYVVRANVNLDDDITNLRALWNKKITEAAFQLENQANTLINQTNLLNQKFPGDPYVNAYWEIDFDGNLTGDEIVVAGQGSPIGSPLGSPIGSGSPYLGISGDETVDITIDGGSTCTISFGSPVTINGKSITGSPLPTVDDLVAEVQSQLNTCLVSGSPIDVVVAIVNGNIRVTSNSTNDGGTPSGSSTSVVVANDTVFSSLGKWVGAGSQTAGVDGYKETLTEAEYVSLVNTVMDDVVYPLFSFANVESDFEDDQSSDPYPVFSNGFDQPAPTNYYGVAGNADCGPGGDPNLGGCPNGTGSNPSFPSEWTAQDASDDLVFAADQFKYTQEFFNLTSLGANDSARRTAIVTALQSEINSNVDIRSENFEWNLVSCPGYPETADELVSLVVGSDIKEEAMVVADTPVSLTPSETVAWAQTTARVTSEHACYYYPWQLASNVDGTNVLISPAGTALRTMAYNDEVAELWFAPAGTRRGLVAGITDLAYVSGTLGGPTTLVETYLNQGQRDDLYRYFVNINPIVFFPGRGILVWGQKTVAANAQSLDRINVKRLTAYIKRQLRKNTLSFVFEPNDSLTRDNLKAVVDSFLSDLVVKRGLYDFASISDETNNTADRIDRNELYIDIAIKPVKAAEFLFIPIRIVSTGTEI